MRCPAAPRRRAVRLLPLLLPLCPRGAPAAAPPPADGGGGEAPPPAPPAGFEEEPAGAAAGCPADGGCKPWLAAEPSSDPSAPGACSTGSQTDMRFVLGWGTALSRVASGSRAADYPEALSISCIDIEPSAECIGAKGVYLLQKEVMLNALPVWRRANGTDGIGDAIPAATLYNRGGFWAVSADGAPGGGDAATNISSVAITADEMPHELAAAFDMMVESVGAEELVLISGAAGDHKEPWGSREGGKEGFSEKYKTYFFCPEVDKFGSLILKGSAEALSKTHGVKMELAVYGTGKYGAPRIPEPGMDARVAVYDPVHPGCHTQHPDCTPNGCPAIATFLVYNFTMRSGQFVYKDKDPVGNGFVPTCEGRGDRATCSFDSASVCIGDDTTGRSNCASCITGSMAVFSTDINVFITYYGSDAGGKTLRSGSSNPMNYRQFAVGNTYEELKGHTSSIADTAKGLVT